MATGSPTPFVGGKGANRFQGSHLFLRNNYTILYRELEIDIEDTHSTTGANRFLPHLWEARELTGSPTFTHPVAASLSRVRAISKLLNSVKKMWGPAHLSVGLPIVCLQLLVASSHAKPQTVHEVLLLDTNVDSVCYE